MKKLLLGLVLSVGVVVASDVPKDDLLSMATMGKSTGTQFEMDNNEMKDVDGGRYYINNRGNIYHSSSASRATYSSSYVSSYSNPNANGYRGTSKSYIYANAFWRFN